MSINGKREAFTREDLLALAATAGIKVARANQMLDRVIAAVRRWPDFAVQGGVPDQRLNEIQRNQLVEL
jgi:serine/threonine-protein kinase HipA